MPKPETTFQPTISVITVVYNRAESIARTLRSVVSQTYEYIEFIVIDGGSQDGTVGIVEKNIEHIDTFISESDSGIADAMNKGASLAKGDYLMFLHSDDYFLNDNSVSELVGCMEEGDEIVSGAILLDLGGKSRRLESKGFTKWLNLKTGIMHQATICRAKTFWKLGGFDTSFRIAMDYDFFLRAYRLNVFCKVIGVAVSAMSNTGVSFREDFDGLSARLREEKRVHYKNSNSTFLRLVYCLWWAVYPRYKLRRLV